MISLRDYQQNAVDAVFDAFGEVDSTLVAACVGAGKTLIQASLFQRTMQESPGARCLSLAHTQELISQNFGAMVRVWPQAPAGINSAALGRRDTRHPILFGSIQSVAKSARQIGHIDLLSVDECFVAGTLISTPAGPVPIETIRAGQSVLHAFGVGIVTATSCKASRNIVRIELSNGSSIRCTGNHPFFTKDGWTTANRLGEGTPLFSKEDVSSLLYRVRSEGRREGEHLGSDAVLYHLLLKESGKRHVDSWREGEDDGNTQSNRSSADGEGRQRADYAGSPETHDGVARGGLDSRDRDTDLTAPSGEDVPNKLQSGHRPSRNEDRCGTRRNDACRCEDSGRQEKRGTSELIRVVSVSLEERGRYRDVFNLQVAGHPSFYAGGALVHNCHLIPVNSTSQYQSFIAELRLINPDMKIVGLSGTPFRLTTGYLHTGPSAMFDSMCFEIGIPELIRRGFLVPPISLAMHTQFDTVGVKTSGGDFAAGELEARVNVDASTKAAVAEMVTIGRAQDRKKWIVFCAGIKHSVAVRDEIRRYGVTCEALDGTTSKTERASMLAAYGRGEIQCLTNVNVLSIGFDDPGIDLLALMRPTKSVGLYIQQCGRGLRCLGGNYEESCRRGKSSCIILDYANLVQNLGPIDAPIVQDEKKKKTGGLAPMKVCTNCQSYNHASARVCSTCEEEFFIEASDPIEPTASLLPILSNETAPETPKKAGKPGIHDWISVDSVAMTVHHKFGAGEDTPPTLKVTYRSGRRVFNEWVCMFHPEGSNMRVKAVQWWKDRKFTEPCPSTRYVDFECTPRMSLSFDAIKVAPQDSGFDRIFHYKMRMPEYIESLEKEAEIHAVSPYNQMLDTLDIDIPF